MYTEKVEAWLKCEKLFLYDILLLYCFCVILPFQRLLVCGGKGKGRVRRRRRRGMEGRGRGREGEGKGRKKLGKEKEEEKEKWAEENVKYVMHDWQDIMKLPGPTAEERSSKFNFRCLCHMLVQCIRAKINVLECLFMFSIFALMKLEKC